MLNLKKMLFLSCLGTISFLEAVQPISDISLSGGWRNDEVKCLIVASWTEDGVNSDRFLDNTEERDLEIAQLGLKGKLALPSSYCDCDSWWLSQFYVKGHAYWGEIYSGRHSSRQYELPKESISSGIVGLGYINSGKSRDYDIGAGFLYPFCNDWGVGVSAGWAYNKLDITSTNTVKTSGNDCDSCDACSIISPLAQGLKFNHKWKGPWVGVDLAYQTCDWDFDLGYEYHWARWNADFKLPVADLVGANCTGFSDKRSGSNGHGHVVFADISTTFNECWIVGVGAKYSDYTVSGKEVPASGTFEQLGCPADEIDRVKHNDWNSFQLTLNVGYRF